jgi:hypothetical protein
MDSTKSVLEHVTPNLCFHIGEIYVCRSAFRCVPGVKHRRTDRYGFNKKHAGTCYAQLVFLHPVGSAGHVVYSCVPGA